LYNYSWFVGFAVAFAAYLLGRKLTSLPRPTVALDQPEPALE
jgi:cytosine/uracil/thiamine/allantoin permease